MKCPRFEQLLDCVDSRLTFEQAQIVGSHLASGCKPCARTRNWYKRVRAIAARDDSREPPPWVLKRAMAVFQNKIARPRVAECFSELIAKLIFDSVTPSAVAGVRASAASSRQIVYQAGDYHIDLQIISSDKSSVDMIGQILRKGDVAFKSVIGLPLGLIHKGKTKVSTVTDSVGQFTINQVRYGEYSLQIETREASISISRLPIRPG